MNQTKQLLAVLHSHNCDCDSTYASVVLLVHAASYALYAASTA
jgi:hypothetical protein